MRIDSILLHNFGSYEGTNIFDTKVKDNKNIILFGGKNGAGKTTLFTAIRICLYGYKSMGYKNQNSFYSRAIIKLINNNAKVSRPTQSYVQLNISIHNGRDLDNYCLVRKWILSDNVEETFEVIKNDITLSQEEIADFESYLISVLPPELLNLYFFDGEKIADFFLNEGSNTRIKEAFLILCGYDTFDIMRKNFRRISATNNSYSESSLDEYLNAKDNVRTWQVEIDDLQQKLSCCINELDTCEAELVALDKNYYNQGGITQEEWDEKIQALKIEEKNRENWNALLKKWANELIPFKMVESLLLQVKTQITEENNGQKYRNFCEIIDVPSIRHELNDSTEKIKQLALDEVGRVCDPLLDLSFEDSAKVLSQINIALSFDQKKIKKCKNAIKRSLATTVQIRQELDQSNVASVKEYMQEKARLFELKSLLLVQRLELEQKLTSANDTFSVAETNFSRIQTRFENKLKKQSISDISSRAIVMLDKLQKDLYQRQIRKVEQYFQEEINTLMRKEHFIDAIHIDEDFSTHVYRVSSIDTQRVIDIVSNNSEEQISKIIGNVAYDQLRLMANKQGSESVIEFCKEYEEDSLDLMFEIDKTSFSNGEKQIYIMALYHSLVKLCPHDVPFIIDTPFARIDTEHRENISKHFFSKLAGQVFILSTNEEIDTNHVRILNDKIAAKYLLQNDDNKRTLIHNSYFEVAE